jgi:hypothetical protein
MNRKTRSIILLIAAAQIGLIIGLLALPSVVQAIPVQYRVRLPEPIVDRFSPAIPTMPAPNFTVNEPVGNLPNFVFDELPTLTPTLTPTPTNTPEPETVELAETNTPAPTPTSTPTPLPTPTPTPPPSQARIDGLRIITQSFNNCGPANLTQLLNFYGSSVTQADVASYLKPNPQDRNVSPWQLSDYVNQFTNLKSTAHSGGDLDLLRRLIAGGFPVVVEIGYQPNTSRSTGWFGHYLTLFSYDDVAQQFLGLDTYLGPWDGRGRTESYAALERNWQAFNYTFFVVFPQEREAEIQAIIGPDFLDPITMWQQAAARARAEIEAEPENRFAWFNLGTSMTRLGERTGEQQYYQQGADAFDRAREIGLPPRMLWYQFRPYMAYMRVGRFDDMIALADGVLASEGGQYVEETFLYKGHALAYKGDIAGARAAYRQALTVNHNFYPAQWALDALP